MNPKDFVNKYFELTSTVAYKDFQNIVQTCSVSTIVGPDGDNIPPTWVQYPGAPATCSGAAAGNICIGASGKVVTNPPSGPNVACNPKTVDIYAAVNEPGVVLACQGYWTQSATPSFPAANPATFVPCNSVTFTGIPPFAPGVVTGSTVKIVPPGATTGIDIQISNPPEGYYMLYVTAWDSAQNQITNPTYGSIQFGVDLTRPNSISITAPPVLIQGFPARIIAEGHLAVNTTPPSPAAAISFGAQKFQCTQTILPSDLWTANGIGFQIAQPGAIWSYKSASGPLTPLAGGTCQTQITSPPALTSGNYTMSAIACDLCGTAAPSPAPVTQNWTVDVDPAPIPAHAPTTLPAADFGTTKTALLPIFAYSAAKLVPLPYEYSCQNVTTPFGASAASCAPATFAAGPCTSQGSTGFCSIAYDGCGRGVADTASPYEIEADLYQSCCQVPCRSDKNYICAIDTSPFRGVCVPLTKCASDAQCPGGGTCFLPGGTCYGAGPGPGTSSCTQTGGGSPAPTPTPTPTATPGSSPAVSVCYPVIHYCIGAGNCPPSIFSFPPLYPCTCTLPLIADCTGTTPGANCQGCPSTDNTCVCR